MSSLTLFILTILAVVVISLGYIAHRLGGAEHLVSHLRTNPKIALGIVAFTVLGLLSAVVFASPSQASSPSGVVSTSKADGVDWFAFGKVYLGLDNTFSHSPQCEPGGASDRLTSNGGFIVNVVQSKDQRFEFNSKYTHHSCAFNGDRNGYNALGLSVEYRLW